MKQPEIVVCGAGIVGIATAYYLAVKHGQKKILLVDKLPPMSLTTSQSGENYRDYWPQACMTAFTSHSIDLMQTLIAEHGNVFDLRNSGYDFVSEQVDKDIFAGMAPELNATKSTLHIDPGVLRKNFPWLSDSVQRVVRINRAGAFDVHALGSLLLKQARAAGLELCYGEITAIDTDSSADYTLQIATHDGLRRVSASRLVLAAGPFVGKLARMVQIDLPVATIRQHKFVIPDPLAAVPESMPFTVFADSQYLQWSDTERELIAEDPQYQWLLDEFPAGLHVKRAGAGHIKLGWAYNRVSEPPHWEIENDTDFPNIVLRGASRFIPGLSAYRENMPTPLVQFSGYYTRTGENWPLIGPLEKSGVYVAAALSGYGTMAACAAGELCADHMMGASLPDYARRFHPARYQDSELVAEMTQLSSDGQL